MAQVTIQIEGTINTIPLVPKEFKTGSIGYHGIGKINSPSGKRYQVNVIVVEIGSKPKKK